MELNAETLCGVDAFRHLSSEDRKRLAVHCRARRYQAGQQIISQHEETQDVFFVVTGRVRITLYSLSGKQITFQDLGAGDMFGELAAIDGAPRSAHVVATAESILISMSTQAFWDALRTYPPVAAATLKRLTRLVRFLSDKVFEVCALPVRDRIYVELLNLARPHRQEDNTAVISPIPTHADIASRIGTHREAVTRVLNDLKHRGVISRQTGKLVIRDVNRLTSMVNAALGDEWGTG